MYIYIKIIKFIGVCVIVFIYLFAIDQEEIAYRKLDILLGAAVVFARGERYDYPFLYDKTVDKGANTIATIIFSLVRYFKSTGSSMTATTLYLQCDGGSENINRTMFALCDMMVRMGWFKNVYMFRLPVGHSHQLIDQFFSTLHPRTNNANSRDVVELITNISHIGHAKTHKNNEYVIWLQCAFDFSSYFGRTNDIYNMRKRIYGWLFTFDDNSEQSLPRKQVQLWYVLNIK